MSPHNQGRVHFFRRQSECSLSGLMKMVCSIQKETDCVDALPPGVNPKVRWAWLDAQAREWKELARYAGRDRILGHVPFWCQSNKPSGGAAL